MTQNYSTGACVYFYFGFDYSFLGEDRAAATYEEIETDARDVIIEMGGSLSHHHGVGKIRERWMPQAISPVGVDIMKKFKLSVDPKNVFCAGNLFWSKH